jgi:hypothetical protein
MALARILTGARASPAVQGGDVRFVSASASEADRRTDGDLYTELLVELAMYRVLAIEPIQPHVFWRVLLSKNGITYEIHADRRIRAVLLSKKRSGY